MHVPSDAQSGLPPGQRIENAAHGLLRDLGRLNRALFRAGDFGLTRSEVSVLDALAAAPLRVTELALRTGMVQPRVTVLLQKLESRELVVRRRCETDRRAVETALTTAGRRLLDQGRQRMAEALLAALHTTPVDDCEAAVCAARQSVAVLVEAMEPEAT
ncbi:MarR family winged helix-turn-helix transcriptional regulator [Streptomyces sp. NRRL S-340]|uniref:MarR family winged helix-turn-helix transcriptional regulator n=1 Tax=Streptomyces sp. NRRL S-340 TaxID=1463901 RepID=UPI00068CB945|nr:MarR family transcriptional regulator [Streptomyces sp. NRRL S-340]